MKQKVTIGFCSHCERCKTKAMEIASSQGVESVTLDGVEKLVVVGDDVDIASLTKKLRRKFCDARILTVEEVKCKEVLEVEKQNAEKKRQEEERTREKEFLKEVLKRHKKCRCWIMSLHGKVDKCCCDAVGEDPPPMDCHKCHPYCDPPCRPSCPPPVDCHKCHPYYDRPCPPSCPPPAPSPQMFFCSQVEDPNASCSVM